MPCYDKKLEAARDDFLFSMNCGENGHDSSEMKIAEVDSVLTSGEMLDLIQVIRIFLNLPLLKYRIYYDLLTEYGSHCISLNQLISRP